MCEQIINVKIVLATLHSDMTFEITSMLVAGDQRVGPSAGNKFYN